MAFDTFIPPVAGKFSAGGSENIQPRVLSANFGDGYGQEAGDGLNTMLADVTVSWEALSPVDGQTIMNFFAAHKGYLPFKFTMPGDASPRKWKCTKWTRNFSNAFLVDISATWKESANPE